MLNVVALSWLLHFFLLSFDLPETLSDAALDDTLSWQSRPLTWNDFKGNVDQRNGSTVAMTSSSINIFYHGYETHPRVTVTCTFYRRKSWVKQEGRNDNVLQHEQLHFDITELFARRLRRTISQLPPSQRSWQNVHRLYDDSNAACNAYQNRYDLETNNGILRNPQQRWSQHVATDLNAVNAYALH